ncbi:hypothetical protein QVD17_13165 [Tagetes erecta]|uniref:Uncharacterized protein n=1 Tax=Tagetes erecta TaxID=13708 RepID=A0AAD8P399_TARER|nr:hypothetical protein QVD17_13165 [Tagetes erecta]
MSFKFKSIKKLVRARDACRSFTEIIRSKLNISKVRKVIKDVTVFFVSSRQNLRFRLMKQRSTISHQYYILQEGSPAIYIGQRYAQKSSQPSREPTIIKDKEPQVGSTGTSTSRINLKPIVAMNHDSLLRERKKDENKNKNKNKGWLHTRDIRGIDERAADFISKVREDMKLQREQSIVEFQEMLARSV